jgi:CDP-paratose 2-epimerase
MRILITGSAGMVGYHAATHFAKQGHEVVAFDALIRSRLAGLDHESVEHNWARLQSVPQVTCVHGDVRHLDEVRRVFQQPVDAVIHAAAQTGVGFSLQHPVEDFAINAQGTLHVLECMRQHAPQAKMIFCSTNKVYGANVDRLAIEEMPSRYAFQRGIDGVTEACSTDLTGHTPYGTSKLTAELYTQDYAQTYGLRTAVFRMSCMYGEHQFGFEDQGWIMHFIVSTLLGRPIKVYGDGKQVRDILYVGDLIAAFDRWLTQDIPHGVYNIGGGPEQTLSLLELLALLKDATGQAADVSYHPWRAKDQKVYISDISHVSQQLDWHPTIGTDAGVRRLITWVSANQDLF